MVAMSQFSEYPTLRLELWTRVALLTTVPVLCAVFIAISVRDDSGASSFIMIAACLALLTVSVISLRLWRSTVLAAERRAADLNASDVWPIVKYSVTHHDGSTAFGGRGWCVISDGRLVLETQNGTVVAAVALSTKTKVGRKAVLKGWAVPRVFVRDDGLEITVELLRASGTPYLCASESNRAAMARRLTECAHQAN